MGDDGTMGGSGDIVQSTRSGPTSSGLNAERAVRQDEADEREGGETQTRPETAVKTLSHTARSPLCYAARSR